MALARARQAGYTDGGRREVVGLKAAGHPGESRGVTGRRRADPPPEAGRPRPCGVVGAGRTRSARRVGCDRRRAACGGASRQRGRPLGRRRHGGRCRHGVRCRRADRRRPCRGGRVGTARSNPHRNQSHNCGRLPQPALRSRDPRLGGGDRSGGGSHPVPRRCHRRPGPLRPAKPHRAGGPAGRHRRHPACVHAVVSPPPRRSRRSLHRHDHRAHRQQSVASRDLLVGCRPAAAHPGAGRVRPDPAERRVCRRTRPGGVVHRARCARFQRLPAASRLGGLARHAGGDPALHRRRAHQPAKARPAAGGRGERLPVLFQCAERRVLAVHHGERDGASGQHAARAGDLRGRLLARGGRPTGAGCPPRAAATAAPAGRGAGPGTPGRAGACTGAVAATPGPDVSAGRRLQPVAGRARRGRRLRAPVAAGVAGAVASAAASGPATPGPTPRHQLLLRPCHALRRWRGRGRGLGGLRHRHRHGRGVAGRPAPGRGGTRTVARRCRRGIPVNSHGPLRGLPLRRHGAAAARRPASAARHPAQWPGRCRRGRLGAPHRPPQAAAARRGAAGIPLRNGRANAGGRRHGRAGHRTPDDRGLDPVPLGRDRDAGLAGRPAARRRASGAGPPGCRQRVPGLAERAA